MSDINSILKRSNSFNLPAPGAATNILTTSLTPVYDGAFRVTVCLATTSVFNVIVTTVAAGGATFTCALNSGTALTGTQLFTFVFGVSTTNTYNFQVATNGVIQILQIDEVCSGVI